MPITDGLDQAVANAGLTLLRADLGPPALQVFDGKVPNGSVPPYVQVYFYLDRPIDDPGNAQDGRSRVWVGRWICHCVGGGDDAVAARMVAQRVRTALLDVRPTIAGFTAAGTGQFRMDNAQPPQRDETTGPLVMDAIQTYRLRLET